MRKKKKTTEKVKTPATLPVHLLQLFNIPPVFWPFHLCKVAKIVLTSFYFDIDTFSTLFCWFLHHTDIFWKLTHDGNQVPLLFSPPVQLQCPAYESSYIHEGILQTEKHEKDEMKNLHYPSLREMFSREVQFSHSPHISHKGCAHRGAPRLRASHPCASWPLAHWRLTAHSCHSMCTGSPWNPGEWTEILDVSLQAKGSILCTLIDSEVKMKNLEWMPSLVQ